MTPNEEWSGYIQALIYPIQFEKNPLDGVERVVEMISKGRLLDATPQTYAEAVRRALASSEELAKLLPQDHSESVIRAYLAGIERRLTGRGEPSLRRS